MATWSRSTFSAKFERGQRDIHAVMQPNESCRWNACGLTAFNRLLRNRRQMSECHLFGRHSASLLNSLACRWRIKLQPVDPTGQLSACIHHGMFDGEID